MMLPRVGLTVPLVRSLLFALAFGAYASVSLLKSHPPLVYVPEIPLALDAVISFIMALLVAFRVNRAYERWWEGRTLWGKLVNVSRNLAVKVRELPHLNRDDHRAARDLIVSFCLALKDHLRDEANLSRLPGFQDDAAAPRHLPSYIARKLYSRFDGWHRSGALSGEQLWMLDAEARWLLEVCGGCERIKATPMPVSWRRVTEKAIAVYLLVLPWGLVDDFGAWTIPLTVVAAYFVITAELIARQVEEPFGVDEDHLDLEGICGVVDRSVSEVLLGD